MSESSQTAFSAPQTASEAAKPVSVVTGANGFVGSHLVDFLLDKGHAVRCLVRKSSNLRWLEGKPVEIHPVGLTDADKLEPVLKGADYVFHVAGVVKARTPQGYFDGNVETTRQILTALTRTHAQEPSRLKRLLVVSSLTASGPGKPNEPVNEDMPMRPITNYGRSKKAQEELLHQHMDKLPITICRPPAIYGERDTEIFLYFKTYNQGLMSTIGLQDKYLSLIHVADLVRGLYLAATHPGAVGETYYITSKDWYSWSQIGDISRQVFGKGALRLRLPHGLVYSVAGVAQAYAGLTKQAATLNIEKARDLVQAYWTCDPDKAGQELGYWSELSLKDGFQRTVDWYRAERWIK